MNFRIVILAAVCTFSAWGSSPALAVVIYTNGVDLSNIQGTLGSDFSGESFGTPVQRADDFELSPGQTTINTVKWFGRYGFLGDNLADDDFSIRIFEHGEGPAPTPLIELQQGVDFSLTRNVASDPFYFEYSATGLDVTLGAFSTYWLSIVDDTTGDADDFFWGATFDDGNSIDRLTEGAAWTGDGNTMAFTLEADDLTAIPEPSSLALLCVCGLGLFRRVRQRGDG